MPPDFGVGKPQNDLISRNKNDGVLLEMLFPSSMYLCVNTIGAPVSLIPRNIIDPPKLGNLGLKRTVGHLFQIKVQFPRLRSP